MVMSAYPVGINANVINTTSVGSAKWLDPDWQASVMLASASTTLESIVKLVVTSLRLQAWMFKVSYRTFVSGFTLDNIIDPATSAPTVLYLARLLPEREEYLGKLARLRNPNGQGLVEHPGQSGTSPCPLLLTRPRMDIE